MSANPQDAQAKLAQMKAELQATTSSGSAMKTAHGSDWTRWPAGHWLNAASLYEQIVEEVGQLVAPTPPPPPPPAVGTGLALIAYAGTLSKRPHLEAYDVVVGDWGDAALLAQVHGKGFAYTITTANDWTKSNALNYTILDPLGNSGLADALKPDDYVAKCANLKDAHPGLHGIFLDNNVAFGKHYQPLVPEATLLPILQHVSDGLKAHGLSWLSNTGGYISGDNGSVDGSIWRAWAQACAPAFEYLLLENWQETPSGVTPSTRRLRGTDAWYKHWDDWQKCVATVPGKFMAATYQHGGDLMYGTYGRASMLTAAGADPGNVFYSAVNNQTDPYGQPWMKANPNPKVDPVAGTATL